MVHGQDHGGVQRQPGVPQHLRLQGRQLERTGVHLEAEEPQDARDQRHGARSGPSADLSDVTGLPARPQDRGSRLPGHGAARGLPVRTSHVG